MVKLEWHDVNTEQTFKPVDPGVYRARVHRCAEKKSKSGDRYFDVEFHEVSSGRHLCFEVIMLSGKGKNLGYTKLKQLGIDETVGELSASDLLGRHVYLNLWHVEYNGKAEAKADIRDNPKFKCGYRSVRDYESETTPF